MKLQNQSSFLSPLFNYLEQFHPISENYKKAFDGRAFAMNVRKSKYLLSPIDTNECLYFICSGIIRGFIKQGGKEITTWFSFGNELIGAIRHPDGVSTYSPEFLQALEDCEVICIPYTLIDKLYAEFPEASVISRQILALQYHTASQRALLARLPSGIDRYRHFLNDKNMDIEKLPLRCVASYLGMRQETLSRIRNREGQLVNLKMRKAI